MCILLGILYVLCKIGAIRSIFQKNRTIFLKCWFLSFYLLVDNLFQKRLVGNTNNETIEKREALTNTRAHGEESKPISSMNKHTEYWILCSKGRIGTLDALDTWDDPKKINRLSFILVPRYRFSLCFCYKYASGGINPIRDYKKHVYDMHFWSL